MIIHFKYVSFLDYEIQATMKEFSYLLQYLYIITKYLSQVMQTNKSRTGLIICLGNRIGQNIYSKGNTFGFWHIKRREIYQNAKQRRNGMECSL